MIGIEFQILYFLQELHGPFLDRLMTGITFLGNGGWIWTAAGFLLLFFPRTRRTGACVLVSLALGFLIGNVGLKNVIARSRPCWLDETIPVLVQVPRDYSFPSGHTLSSFAGAVSIWRMHPRWGWAALFLAGLIGFSRLYLFVHFPTDVPAGAVIGTALALWVTGWARARAQRRGGTEGGNVSATR